jgi:hypothetical protein
MIKKFENFSLFEDLGDIFHPLEDDWNVDILVMVGLEIKSKIAGKAQMVGRGSSWYNAFKNDPYHFYFYQEGGPDVGLYQTFTDGGGFDVMGMERKLLIMRPPNWIDGGKISFDYDNLLLGFNFNKNNSNLNINCQKNNLRKLNYGFRFDKFYNPENRRTNHERNLQLLNIGSFQHKKNQTFLIDIAREFKKKMNNF